jgi:hypothetical protein
MKQCKDADIPYNNIPVHIAFQSHNIKLEPTKKSGPAMKPNPMPTTTLDEISNSNNNTTTLGGLLK